NGEYFIQIPDPTPRKDYNTGCYTDQMLGQWWAQLVDLGWIYPEEHVRSAMRALFDYNFRTHFHGFTQSPRKFVVDDEAAMVQCTWPRGGRPEPEHTMLHADEVKVGISYSVAALMIRCGLLNKAFAVTRANADRYDGRLRTGLDNSPWGCWGYSGNPFGDDCAGKFYVRALSTWSLLLACQGQIYNGPENLLGFDPAWRPEDHVSFFTTAKGWGLFSQRRAKATQDDQSNETTQEENISLKWGTLKLRRLVFVLPDDAKPGKVAVSINGNPVEATQTAEEQRLYIDLGDTRTLEAGDVLTVSITLQ
ncbi:MAG TPA: glucosylceramidase, partial [Planctomycetaceae bacterium]|nr:glucosylceramidase [Planctomycetaceae bacterium]